MAFAAAAAIAAAGAAAYGAYETGQASQRAGVAAGNAANIQRRQMELSKQQQEAALAGTTNARGDRTEYIPGVGWVETASPLTRALMGRSDAEEGLRLSQDMPRARAQREEQYRVQQGERGLANAVMARSNIGTRSLGDVEADAIRLGVARAAAPRQALDNAAVISALRQGSGAQEMLAQTGRGVGNDTRIALEEARSNAPRAFADNESARSNDALNRYGALMSRALAPDGVAFTPNTLADSLTGSRAAQQRNTGTALGYASHFSKPENFNTDTTYGAQIASAIAGLQNLYNNKGMQETFGYGQYNPGMTRVQGQTVQASPALSDALQARKGSW